MAPDAAPTPAQVASAEAYAKVLTAIGQQRSFKLEAGAGAGKTYSLINVLKHLIERHGNELARSGQRVACITFTNVAKDEILKRVDRHPAIQCETIHGFCWSLISPYQSYLRAALQTLGPWTEPERQEQLELVGGITNQTIKYDLGFRSVSESVVTLHHNDILPLTVNLLEFRKFRLLLKAKYPFILIDEYQDTDRDLVEALAKHFFGKRESPLIGFFGDHWQQIYDEMCGEIIHANIEPIGKAANFRSASKIVECLNRLRPTLTQEIHETVEGDVQIFHTNEWRGERRTGAHYGGDLLDDESENALNRVIESLRSSGWTFSPKTTKILMLTHRALGGRQGYKSLPDVFQDNNAFARKDQAHIEFFADRIEPACRAFVERRYGHMFDALGLADNHLKGKSDKKKWTETMGRLIELRENGNVHDVVSFLRQSEMIALSEGVERLETNLERYVEAPGVDIPRSLAELKKLHSVSYKEIIALSHYLDGHSPFETKHGVKGAEFEDVLVVIGRGWNKYNFGQMLENFPNADRLIENELRRFRVNRNLFYVACSRPRKRLALLFTQKLSDQAVATVHHVFSGAPYTSVY